MPQKDQLDFPLSAEASIDSPPAERDGSIEKHVPKIHLVDRGRWLACFVFGRAVCVGATELPPAAVSFLAAFRLRAALNRRNATAACPTDGEEVLRGRVS